ncbi:MAG: FAD-dependent oxidoreductase [Eubacterium sp.]|jgi:glutamate synthase (NADPH/NADH) small chain|nr:FAD-dependent oxidoreductase [Eubacterium sp.]
MYENQASNNHESALEIKTIKYAIKEANRCLNCKKPACKAACPIENDIPDFINALAYGDIGEARTIIGRKSNLPAVCGRVCAHEVQCEGACVLNKTGKGIKIGALEQTIADFAFEMELPHDKLLQKTRGNVAVIGSGPAGLTVAGDLAKSGFAVTVFEALDEPGGVLLYGIPSFRLSKRIVRREITNIEALGVRFRTNCVIGKDTTVDQMFYDGFDAIFIGTGTAISKELPLPGYELEGILQSSYLLRMRYLYSSHKIKREEVMIQEGDRVLVVGAGNVGMDAARTAKRLGAESVMVVHRGGEESITALPSEHEAALKEGVAFHGGSEPLEYIGENGKLTGLKIKTINGEKMLHANKLLLAIGSRPANRIVSTTHGIEVDNDGYVIIKERPYGMTTRKGVFAGGDVVHRPATVVLAMSEAKKVAAGIVEYVDAVKLLEM